MTLPNCFDTTLPGPENLPADSLGPTTQSFFLPSHLFSLYAQQPLECSSKFTTGKRVKQRVQGRMKVCEPASHCVSDLHGAGHCAVHHSYDVDDFERQPANHKAEDHYPKCLCDLQFPRKFLAVTRC